MILYHGTNIEIDEIDFDKCRPYKDFGQASIQRNYMNRLKKWQGVFQESMEVN